MSVPPHLQPIVEAIVLELDRQHGPDYGPGGFNPDADWTSVAIAVDLDLVALARAVLFCPTGDNHHNAAACPYCQGPSV